MIGKNIIFKFFFFEKKQVLKLGFFYGDIFLIFLFDEMNFLFCINLGVYCKVYIYIVFLFGF